MGDNIERSGPGVRTAYFTYGRMNPPTIGHARLIRGLIDLAAKAGERSGKADAYVFPTSTAYKKAEDQRKNPLPIDIKVGLLKLMFPDPSEVRIINTKEKGCNAIPVILKMLTEAGYERKVMVVGSDRVADFEGRFEGVEVVSGGERDPDEEGAAGMSATKVRAAAEKGDWPGFRSGLNRRINNSTARSVMGSIQAALEGVEEEPRTSKRAKTTSKRGGGGKTELKRRGASPRDKPKRGARSTRKNTRAN